MTAPVASSIEERDGRSSRWDEHREARRREILDAAAALVESLPPGAELALQDVADRAGLVHTVVRRHFGGRLALIRAVQADVLEQAFALVSTPIDPEASLHDAAYGYMQTAVAWVDAHPGLHALVERELGDGLPSELSLVINAHAERLASFSAEVMALFGITLTEAQAVQWRLIYAGIIGQVRATVGFWITHTPRPMAADDVAALLAGTVSRQVVEFFALHGPAIDARRPINEQVAELLGI